MLSFVHYFRLFHTPDHSLTNRYLLPSLHIYVLCFISQRQQRNIPFFHVHLIKNCTSLTLSPSVSSLSPNFMYFFMYPFLFLLKFASFFVSHMRQAWIATPFHYIYIYIHTYNPVLPLFPVLTARDLLWGLPFLLHMLRDLFPSCCNHVKDLIFLYFDISCLSLTASLPL